MSRTDRPKQFLDLFGTGRSLLQQTYDRILPICGADHIILVTNVAYKALIREQLPDIKESNILLEPARRNTAPCVCWAAHHIEALDPEASIVTLPSDHLILKEQAFVDALTEGFAFVEENDALLTIGIKPNSPHTGYGYIQLGNPVKEWPGIRKVKSFTEKPDLEMAKVFLQSGEFYWNSGMFLWKAKSILRAFDQHAPEIASLFNWGNGSYGTRAEVVFIEKNFPNAVSISIDYAIMEKAANVYVKTADLGWSDLGSWKALYDASPKNREGNVTQGCKALVTDCQGSVIAAEGDKIVVVAGLKDYIVADTDKALLIYPKVDEQKIKNIVNEVQDRFGEEYV